MDLFSKIKNDSGPLGQYYDMANGYFMFPILEGELGPNMLFNGKKILNWSLNDYLGLGNHPAVREADALAAQQYGAAYPMGARMMSGNTKEHEKLERQLADFTKKEEVLLLNFGYQGMLSLIQAICKRTDVIVFDSECHACILDGVYLHVGKRFVYKHNDIPSLEQQLRRASEICKKKNSGILLVTEGVFGMSGAKGKLKEIVALKKKYNFRILVDDAHGFGTMGKTGYGTGEDLGVQDEIDLYFSTFAKSMASIGAFVGATKEVITYLRCNMRSQVFAKSLPMIMVKGVQKRLSLITDNTKQKDKLWKIVNALQTGLKDSGFNTGVTEAPVTPVYLNGNLDDAVGITQDLRETQNIFCSIVAFPVVPKDVILLRLIPTASHTLAQVEKTVEAFKSVKETQKRAGYANKFSEYVEQAKKNS